MPKLSTAAKQLLGDYVATIGLAGAFSAVFMFFMPLPKGLSKAAIAIDSTLVLAMPSSFLEQFAPESGSAHFF